MLLCGTHPTKIVYIDPRARKELEAFSEKVQEDFDSFFDILRERGRLGYPDGKKIDTNLFEIRVTIEGAHRAFYAYIGPKHVVVVHCFQKKTQHTPLKNIKTAKRRTQEYERGTN